MSIQKFSSVAFFLLSFLRRSAPRPYRGCGLISAVGVMECMNGLFSVSTCPTSASVGLAHVSNGV